MKALTMYPTALSNAGEFEKASAAYDMATEQNPVNHSLYFGKARTLTKMGRYEDALIFFEKALELSPSNINYQYMHAQTLAEMGRIKEASQSAEKVLAKNKSHARARIIVADYLRLSGKLNEALSHYEIAAKTLEIKTYAEYFIEEVKRQIEEQEIEEKWKNFQKHQ